MKRVNIPVTIDRAMLPITQSCTIKTKTDVYVMVNRSAVLLKYKDPFVLWANAVDPYDGNPEITLEDANTDCTVYLISEDDAVKLKEWILLNFKQLFESELEDWYTDESLWPKKRNRELFDEWFDVECHSIIIDTVGGKIVDDET